MDHSLATAAQPPYDLISASTARAPLVLASPHSGCLYPPELLLSARVDLATLRRAEDCLVDELFASGPSLGAPLLRALFPRAWVDANREPWELDPGMFDERLPDWVNTASARIAAGLGTIPRLAANGEAIYRDALTFSEAVDRIEACHRPYHARLAALLEETRQQFGFAILLDCHSMPTVGAPHDRSRGRADIVLGDCHGRACDPRVTAAAERTLRALGWVVHRNAPYSGGYTTQHYGRPQEGFHALQIEICRGLYMDEVRLERGDGFSITKTRLDHLLRALAALDLS